MKRLILVCLGVVCLAALAACEPPSLFDDTDGAGPASPTEPAVLPVADFTWFNSGLTATFSNRSSGATRYRWLFGDGSESTQAHPVHEYPRQGTYSVRLEAFGSGGISASREVFVTVP